MSATKRVVTNLDGEPVLTVKVVGAYDIYRFAGVMQRGQVEFARLGYFTKRSLRRQLGAERFNDLRRYLEGDGFHGRGAA